MKKTRPAVVVSSDGVCLLPLRLVVPLTAWQPRYERNFWHVRVEADQTTGLDTASAADAFQVRSVAVERFLCRRGRAPAGAVRDIVAAIALLVETE
jgi:mRNA interferase MazF